MTTSALSYFVETLPRGPSSSRVLVMSTGEGAESLQEASRFFSLRGLETEAVDPSKKDLRLWSPPREAFEGAFVHRSLGTLPPEGLQRVLACLFAALKPGASLFLSFEQGAESLTQDQYSAAIRQSGFHIVSVGTSPARAKESGASEALPLLGFVARRIG